MSGKNAGGEPLRNHLENQLIGHTTTSENHALSYIITTLGVHRGSPRLWLQGPMPERAGFLPGARYRVDHGPRHIALRIGAGGTRTVSKKERRERVEPVIDVNSREDLRVFVGMTRLRIIIRSGEILVTPLESELRILERENRLIAAAASRTVSTGALAFGGGVMDHVMHTAFQEIGLDATLAFANEIREDLASHAMSENPVIRSATTMIVAPLQEAAFDERLMKQLPRVDVLLAGLPCSAASRAGRAKRHLAVPEAHPEVGHLIAAAIVIIARTSPSFFVMENVPTWATSASAAILRTQLRDLGYVTHEVEFNAADFGDLEARRRWCLIAVSRGLTLSLDNLQSEVPVTGGPRTLGEVLEHHDAPHIAERWSTMDGLRAKEARDKEEGKGFKMQIYDASSPTIGTMTAGMSKVRSTDPKIRHPHKPELLRVPTALEHCRIKGIDPALIDGLSHTVAHEMLGQSVCSGPFRAIFTRLGRAILDFTALPSMREWEPAKTVVSA